MLLTIMIIYAVPSISLRGLAPGPPLRIDSCLDIIFKPSFLRVATQYFAEISFIKDCWLHFESDAVDAYFHALLILLSQIYIREYLPPFYCQVLTLPEIGTFANLISF